jgi:DNA-binding MarR family transcriptional regulator
MTRAGTTNMIDRLERAGFAERSDVDDDHRGVLVALTPVGIDAVDAMTDRVTEVYLQNAAMFASWGICSTPWISMSVRSNRRPAA